MPKDKKAFEMNGRVEILSTEDNGLIATGVVQGWTNFTDHLILMLRIKDDKSRKINKTNADFVYLRSTEKKWVLLSTYGPKNFEEEFEKAIDSKERFLVISI